MGALDIVSRICKTLPSAFPRRGRADSSTLKCEPRRGVWNGFLAKSAEEQPSLAGGASRGRPQKASTRWAVILAAPRLRHLDDAVWRAPLGSPAVATSDPGSDRATTRGRVIEKVGDCRSRAIWLAVPARAAGAAEVQPQAPIATSHAPPRIAMAPGFAGATVQRGAAPRRPIA